MAVQARQIPAVVLTYAILQVGDVAYGLENSPRLWHRPIPAAAVVLILMLWLAAIVVWRQRWAWGLAAIAYLVALLEPAWNRHFASHSHDAVFYAFDLVMAGLLISAPMRRYVGAIRRPAATSLS